MLTETIASSINAISAKREAQDRKKSNDDFFAALAALDKACIQLDEVVGSISALQKSGITSKSVITATTKSDLLSSIDACGIAVTNNSLSRDTVKVLSTQTNTAKKELSSEWTNAAVAYADGPRGYIAMIAGLTDDPRKARKLIDDIKDIVESAATEKQISALVSKVTEANAMTASFSLEPPIETFLKKVSSSQATVADLTPTVQNWLKEKKLMGKLKINF